MGYSMIWKKRKHPLPKFPEAVRSIFKSACENLSVENAETLRSYLDKCMNGLKASVADNPTIDLKLATEISNVCEELLDRYEQFNPKHRTLVVGAIRYFAVAEDPFPDEAFASGFDDDARVLNHVLEHLGLDEYYVDVPE